MTKTIKTEDQKGIAHKTKDGREQSLEAHLTGVADLAQQFAAEFDNGDWGKQIGLWHDLGKYNPKWQEYLRSQTEDYYMNPKEEEEE